MIFIMNHYLFNYMFNFDTLSHDVFIDRVKKKSIVMIQTVQ